jgi:hypothetical protein
VGGHTGLRRVPARRAGKVTRPHSPLAEDVAAAPKHLTEIGRFWGLCRSSGNGTITVTVHPPTAHRAGAGLVVR